MKEHWSQNLQFWLRNWSKIAPPKRVDYWVFVNHPAVYSGGVSRGLWQLLLALVTCDR